MWRLAPSIAKDILQFCEGVGILKNFRIVFSLEKICLYMVLKHSYKTNKFWQEVSNYTKSASKLVTSKIWMQILDLTLVTDSDKIWNMKNLVPENLDPEKTGPWNADAKITGCRKTISRPHSMICWYWKSIKKTLSKRFEKVIIEAS